MPAFTGCSVYKDILEHERIIESLSDESGFGPFSEFYVRCSWNSNIECQSGDQSRKGPDTESMCESIKRFDSWLGSYCEGGRRHDATSRYLPISRDLVLDISILKARVTGRCDVGVDASFKKFAVCKHRQ